MLPDVLDTQLPAEAKGIETDLRGNLEGVISGDTVIESAPFTRGLESSSTPAVCSNLGGAEAVETILGFIRWTRRLSSLPVQMRLVVSGRACGLKSPNLTEPERPRTVEVFE